MPLLRVFLDIDDLADVSELEAHVDASDAVIVFLAGSLYAGGQRSDYFGSTNCLREFRRAVREGKPTVLVLETDPQHGGVSMDTHRAACPAELRTAFDAMPVVPWYRVRDFQLVSLRQLLRRLLQERPSDAIVVPLPPLVAPRVCQLCTSEHNPGAAEVAERVAARGGLNVGASGVLVLLLRRHVYKSHALQQEVEAALRAGQPPLLVHDQRGPEAVPFAHFLGSEDGEPVTPPPLAELGLYRALAVPLYGGEHDEATVRLLLAQLATRASPQRRLLRASTMRREELPPLLEVEMGSAKA